MGILNELKKIVKGSLNWRVEKDDERPGKVVHIAETTAGNHIIQDEGDGTFSWVLTNPEDGFPLDLRCGLRSVEEAKTHAESVWNAR